jgi:phage-related protein
MVQLMSMGEQPILRVVFFRSGYGDEPVREWLKELDKEDRKLIGEDIKLVQFRWPLGLPLVRKLEADLWEVRSRISGSRIARTCFTVRAGEMALLHGFIKKSQKTPRTELEIARRRKNLWLLEQDR